MAEQNLGPRDFFAKEDAIADLGLIACPGAEELCKLVDSHLVRWAREVGNTDVDTFIIPSDCPRFQSGDAKGLVKASTRGDDLYIFVDPGNYSVTYQLFGYENHPGRCRPCPPHQRHHAQPVRRPSASPRQP